METSFIAANWIPDRNRFSAPKPPEWFLKALWDQDAQLVILPSRIGRKYILARRRQKSSAVPVLVKAHNKLMIDTRGSDGDMLASYNLLGVDTIKGNIHGTWSPAILQELRERDMWPGGADKFIDKLEEGERKVEATKRANFQSDMEHRAGDAWRSLQARTGQRNQHSNAGHKKSAKVSKPSRQPSSSTAGSGFQVHSGFTGR